MTVDGVNNNSNAGLYATSAALIGGGAGAAAGWYSKPFLKDGAPTDEFVKKMGENLKAELPEDMREIANDMEARGKEMSKILENATSVEDYKTKMISNMFEDLTDANTNDLREVVNALSEGFQTSGLKIQDPEMLAKIQGATSLDEMKAILGEAFDKQYAGKSIEEIKQAVKSEAKAIERHMAQGVFEQFWDSGKKAFVDCEEGAGKAIKKAAQSIQGKYAAIYGAIGAGVLGLGALLCCGGKKAPEQLPKEAVDTQA